MTTSRQIAFVPQGEFSNGDLKQFLLELERFHNGKEVMHSKDAAAFIGISVSTLYRVHKEKLPYHMIEGLGGRLYLRSEILEAIKKG